VLSRFLGASSAAGPPARAGDAVDEVRQVMGHHFELVATQYLADATRSLAAMRAALASGDRDAIDELAHRLKGSSGIVGAGRVAQVCERIRSNGASIDTMLSELEHEVASVRERLLPAGGHRR
jgi:HPt (histidine-containing phosphotransfer) domain-containing protein